MTPTRITSRLAKKEEQKIAHQTIYIVLAAVVMLLLFILVIMPAAIKMFFGWLDKGSTSLINDDQIPPQMPVIVAPLSATNSATLAINGYAEAYSKLQIQVNHQLVDELDIGEKGEFSYEADLTEGENAISLTSVDEAENESAAKELLVIMDTTVPEIELTAPSDGAEFELKTDQLIEVKGKTEPKAKVYLNDRLGYANDAGEFSWRHQLQQGSNELVIKAIDQAGNQAETKLTVKYRD